MRRCFDTDFDLNDIESRLHVFCEQGVPHDCVREDGKNFNRYKGKKLKEVLSRFPKDQCMDLDVEWAQLKGWIFRLVVRWNDKKQKWVFIVTNLDRAGIGLIQNLWLKSLAHITLSLCRL